MKSYRCLIRRIFTKWLRCDSQNLHLALRFFQVPASLLLSRLEDELRILEGGGKDSSALRGNSSQHGGRERGNVRVSKEEEIREGGSVRASHHPRRQSGLGVALFVVIPCVASIASNHSSFMEARSSVKTPRRQFNYDDQWVMSSVTLAATQSEDQLATLREIIATGDYLEHGIFTFEELEGGLARLAAGGCIEQVGDRFRPSTRFAHQQGISLRIRRLTRAGLIAASPVSCLSGRAALTSRRCSAPSRIRTESQAMNLDQAQGEGARDRRRAADSIERGTEGLAILAGPVSFPDSIAVRKEEDTVLGLHPHPGSAG